VGPIVLAAPRRIDVKFVGEHRPINHPTCPIFDAPADLLGVEASEVRRQKSSISTPYE